MKKMLKLIDVYGKSDDPRVGRPHLASPDVTDNTEEEQREILGLLKEYYGTECKYILHDCYHDQIPFKRCDFTEA